MDQERFEELLLAEIDGRLTLDQRAQLDAACEHDSALNRFRKHDLRIARMMRSIAPTRVPPALAADVMRRFEMEVAGESEQERYEEPARASRAPYEEDPFETTSSGTRYREVYEAYREPVAVRSATPWWSMIFGSTFMRVSFAMSVLIVCVYMGSVIMKQTRGGGSLLPGFEASPFPQSADAGSDTNTQIAGGLVPAEPTPESRNIQIARLENPNPTAIDLNALADITPIPAIDGELPEDPLNDGPSEEESVGHMDPAIEKMLAANSNANQATEAAAAAAIAAMDQPATTQAASVAPTTPTVPSTTMTTLTPVVVAQAKPQVDLPEAEVASAEKPAVDPSAIASAATAQPEAGAGMEKVFDRIKTDLETKDTQVATSTPPDAREVKDAQELRTALAERTVASAPAAEIPETVAPASATQTQPTKVMTEVEEMRKALSGQGTATTAKSGAAKSFPAPPPVKEPAAPVQVAKAEPASAAPTKSESEKMSKGLVPSGAPPKVSPEERLRKIEMAIVRNGGTILARKPDTKDPSTTRVKVLMTRAQIRSLEHDLARQGLAPAKKAGESASDAVGVGDKPVEFEILVKAR